MAADILPGRSYPLGATVFPEGVNFSVFSKNCYSIDLLLFDDVDSAVPSRIIHLDPAINKTFYYWHVFVKGIGSGQIYGYRSYGPYNPADGDRFDGWKVLLDPYSRGVVVGKNYDRQAAIRPGDNCLQAMKSVVVDCKTYDWEGDEPLRHPFSKTVIYEMHVAGFTRNPNSGVPEEKRGTYAGLIEKIPYLKELGVTAVELLPIQQFDEQDAPPPHTNYWGYSPICFFAPHAGYSFRRDPLGPVDEFRDMVKALHRAGIEVILDVVFNHTAEGNENGPTFCLRGFENKAYYLLEKDRSKYANFSGCGNTIKANHSIVRRMILDSLRYWASFMHVDGFRFDLASVMARGEEGEPLANPPILWSIESDPILAGTKIIAEAWDAAGLYQVGSFVGHRWAEWNGRFRDDMRQFMKGDPDCVKRIANRICASPDLYEQAEREPNRSINFITGHDGFTLNDLVSYNEKHNEENGEANEDGSDFNFSWNFGVEGPTDQPEIEALRLRQIKNFLTILMISQGTPMLLMGDEVRRTQSGNNNAYCQDNELSWFDWSATEKQGDLFRFVKELIRFNLSREIFRDTKFWTAPNHEPPRITFHGVNLGKPDWSPDSHSLAFTLHTAKTPEYLHVMINAYWEPLIFTLPALPSRDGKGWHRVIDTSLPHPDDFCRPDEAPLVTSSHYKVEPRSIALLVNITID